jgi:hypothetical protein
MSEVVRVDLSSAAIAYRPAAGEQRCLPVGDVSSTALFRAAPWRTFRSYFGQRHYSGFYWSATERDHVIYESRLELANLMLADFDPTVHHIVAQPFQLSANVDEQQRRHIPDYLWASDEGPIVVDVVRTERMTHPPIVKLCAWTKKIVESMGWSYLVVNEPAAICIANVRFLAGYRRQWLVNQDVLADLPVGARRCSLGVAFPSAGPPCGVVGSSPGSFVCGMRRVHVTLCGFTVCIRRAHGAASGVGGRWERTWMS